MENQDIINFTNEWINSQGMSDFQSRYFVVNSQVTNYRRVRQALIELDNRIGAEKQIVRQRKKRIIEKQILQRDYDNETDDLKKQLIQVDIEQADWDIHMYNKKERQCQTEAANFINMIKTLVPDKESLEKYKDHDEEAEREYWVTRMAKQAAMDLSTVGRITQGNLDSILMMPLSEVKDTIGLAIQYNGILEKGMQAIEEKTTQRLSTRFSNDIAYIDDVAKDPQLKIETKSKGETI
jgi:hypothetical protein